MIVIRLSCDNNKIFQFNILYLQKEFSLKPVQKDIYGIKPNFILQIKPQIDNYNVLYRITDYYKTYTVT